MFFSSYPIGEGDDEPAGDVGEGDVEHGGLASDPVGENAGRESGQRRTHRQQRADPGEVTRRNHKIHLDAVALQSATRR